MRSEFSSLTQKEIGYKSLNEFVENRKFLLVKSPQFTDGC